jgi:SAM-dependent methyltransferase
MDELLPRVRAATTIPTADERLADLIELHTARPGVTEATLGAWTMADGRTGYELCADAVPEDARRVLDLGCGNGPLLAAIARARPGVTTLAGVDACASEIAIAEARLPADRADLRCERADRISFEDGSMDVVVSHHALYLFEPVPRVLAEVARVLRPGGLLTTVAWTYERGDVEPFASMMRVMGELTARDAPSFRGWADRRHFDRAAIEALLVEAGFAPPLVTEEHELVIEEPAEAIADRLMRFLYSVDVQQAETRAELRAAWIELLAATRGASGRATLAFPFALTRLCKRA